MNSAAELPRELVWGEEGHLSEIAMTAIADGEEAILPRDAFGHLGVCAVCAAGVEGAAKLSTSVGRALAIREPVLVRRAFPVRALSLTLLVAAVATVPNLHSAQAWILHAFWIVREALPIVTRHSATLLPHAWAWFPLMSCTAAMLLMLAGLSVARFAPRTIERSRIV